MMDTADVIRRVTLMWMAMGLSGAERARRYRDRKRGGPPIFELKPHPSRAAVMRHQRAGEKLCAACEAFERDRQHQLYLARKAKQQA